MVLLGGRALTYFSLPLTAAGLSRRRTVLAWSSVNTGWLLKKVSRET